MEGRPIEDCDRVEAVKATTFDFESLVIWNR
jgi:hypothetical protein